MSDWAIEDVLLIFSETETNATPPARKQLDQQDNLFERKKSLLSIVVSFYVILIFFGA